MIGAKLVDRRGGLAEDPHGGGVVGVAERGAQQEAVELRLGQAVRAGLLDGVLRRDHEERLSHRTGDAVDRDVPLLHHLEQRRLGLRARPVDLVGEHDVREDRAGVEGELAGLLVVHRDAGDVARQEVGGELDACARALHRLRDRAGERGLARAGHVFEQHVALAEHRGEHELDDVALAEHRPLDVVGDGGEGLREPGGLFGGDRHGVVAPSVGGTGVQRAERGAVAASRFHPVRAQSTMTRMPSTRLAVAGTCQGSSPGSRRAPAAS